jgi:predicted nucleotidyltransferase
MMQTKSFGSVRVFEPETKAVAVAIEALKELLATFPEVTAVYLIGSYHRGDFGPFSDVDIAVVVKNSPDRFIDRPDKYRPIQFPLPLDLFVYSETEVTQMKESGHPFWRQIEQQHTVLFERSDG